jgi:hypothetical protein
VRKIVKGVSGFMLGIGLLVTLIGIIRMISALVIGYGTEQIEDLLSAAIVAGAGVVTVLFSGTAWLLVGVSDKVETLAAFAKGGAWGETAKVEERVAKSLPSRYA